MTRFALAQRTHQTIKVNFVSKKICNWNRPPVLHGKTYRNGKGGLFQLQFF